jgi:fatty acid amide hydrolase
MSETVSSDVLTSTSVRELVQRLTAKDLSAVALLDAVRHRIDQLNPQLNALVVSRWEGARMEAERADSVAHAEGTLGPLHGLPVTIKETFDVAGMATTAGIRSRRHLLASHDAPVVQRLRKAGAIVVGKTNVPQLGMYPETDNPLFGCTLNPWNVERGPGGSSGGEAALIAAGGSLLGLGSDGGGSIRQPAHACGICGFKPTGGRLSMQGHWISANWPVDWAQPGPMARTVDDLQLAFEVLAAGDGGQPVYGGVPLPVARGEDLQVRGLRVGVYEELAELPATAAVRRAVRLAAAALQAVGVDVVAYRPDRVAETWDLFSKMFYAEGLRDMQRQMRGSPLDPRVRMYFRMARLPRAVRATARRVAGSVGQVRIAHLLNVLRRPVLSADRYCHLLLQMHGLRLHFARQLRRQQLDALLGPVSPVPALRHGEFYANYSLIYTGIYNLLGVPAGTVPVTRVRADELPSGEAPRDWIDRALWRTECDSQGLPVGVQVIGPWWFDERVLALMRHVQQSLALEAEYPTTPPQTLPPVPLAGSHG